MPRSWRIVKSRFADDVLSGEGARRYGGRWTSPGLPVVYTAEHASLAVLEVLVNLGSPRVLGAYVILSVDFEEAMIRRVQADELPAGWRASPPLQALREIGDTWLRSKASAVLGVPSAVLPMESNYLLNPVHADFGRLKAGRAEPFVFDPRLE